jgi:hypothetical protein
MAIASKAEQAPACWMFGCPGEFPFVGHVTCPCFEGMMEFMVCMCVYVRHGIIFAGLEV